MNLAAAQIDNESGAEAPPPAAPLDASPAPTLVPPPAAIKRGRGRPPGSGDRRPRKRKEGSGAPKPAAIRPPSTDTPNLFDAAMPGSGQPAATVPPPTVNLAATIDPATLATTALSVGAEVFAVAASMRYPKHIVDQAIRFQPSELETLQPLLTEWIKSSTTQIDPGTAFLIFGGMMLGTHILIAERMRAAEMPQPSPPVPPPSASQVSV